MKGTYFNNKRHVLLHYCDQKAPNYDAAGRYLHEGWGWVNPIARVCVACYTEPPSEMQGFMALLQWER